jgi:hypothetical protein
MLDGLRDLGPGLVLVAVEFESIGVVRDSYLLELCRDAAFNPVRAATAK